MRFFALAIVSAVLLAAPAKAQHLQPKAHDVKHKDPVTATLFGVLLPGGGHIYAGDAGNGFTILGVTAASVGFGSFMAAGRLSTDCNSGGCGETEVYTPLVVGGAVGLAAYVYGILDAGDAAHRYNRRHSLALRPASDGAGLAVAIDL